VLNLALLQNWGLIRASWNIPSWSISAEWLMYLLFPLLAMPRFWNAASASKLFVTMVVIVAAQTFLVLAKGWTDYGGMSLGGMTRVVFEFLLGYAAWHFNSRIAPRATPLFNLVQLAIACGLMASVLVNAIWLAFVPFAAALICTLGNRDAALSKGLATKPLVYLGEISYSLYMWHWLVLNVANTADLPKWLGPAEHAAALATLVQLMLVLMVAAVSYRFIEQPCRKSIVRLAAPRRRIVAG
jgi:peptidoglycan/LPS O-acetylase OafA/YrhL